MLTQPFIQTQIKENIKAPRHWPLCWEFTGTGELPAQRASYAENVSIWWRHHGTYWNKCFCRLVRPMWQIHRNFLTLSEVFFYHQNLLHKVWISYSFTFQMSSITSNWHNSQGVSIGETGYLVWLNAVGIITLTELFLNLLLLRNFITWLWKIEALSQNIFRMLQAEKINNT